jgi:hypothetical protein
MKARWRACGQDLATDHGHEDVRTLHETVAAAERTATEPKAFASDNGATNFLCHATLSSRHRNLVRVIVGAMKRLGSFVKGYTLGTLFVLVHVATHELRTRRLSE